MGKLLIFIFSILLLGFEQSMPKEIYFKSKPVSLNAQRLKTWPKMEAGLYVSTQTGDKSHVSKPLKKVLKEFGLIHLLTPSGIHLSSLLLFLFLFLKKKYKVYVYVLLLFIFIPLSGFYSLKRIIYFHILQIFLKNIRASFLLTFVLDLILGGYLNSQLSFIYSFLFWGVIIFHKGTKFKLILSLFCAQLILCYFNQTNINFFALIINPVVTSIFSLIFPLLSINYWFIHFDFFDGAIIQFFNYFKNILFFLNRNLEIFRFIPVSIVLFIPFFLSFRLKHLVLFSLLFIQDLNPSTLSAESKKQIYIPLGKSSEVINIKKLNVIFLDRKCSRKFKEIYWEIKCKKKPSSYGGFSI